jgi:hypothetical protein
MNLATGLIKCDKDLQKNSISKEINYCSRIFTVMYTVLTPEPEFVNLFRSAGIDSQPGLLKRLQIQAQFREYTGE